MITLLWVNVGFFLNSTTKNIRNTQCKIPDHNFMGENRFFDKFTVWWEIYAFMGETLTASWIVIPWLNTCSNFELKFIDLEDDEIQKCTKYVNWMDFKSKKFDFFLEYRLMFEEIFWLNFLMELNFCISYFSLYVFLWHSHIMYTSTEEFSLAKAWTNSSGPIKRNLSSSIDVRCSASTVGLGQSSKMSVTGMLAVMRLEASTLIAAKYSSYFSRPDRRVRRFCKICATSRRASGSKVMQKWVMSWRLFIMRSSRKS